MTIQTVELLGERYVILREKEFLELEGKAREASGAESQSEASHRFRHVTPLKVGGVPASELLIQDRQ